jgi:hypothetical protein
MITKWQRCTNLTSVSIDTLATVFHSKSVSRALPSSPLSFEHGRFDLVQAVSPPLPPKDAK